MAWFRINETKYLFHCIKQLKKLALDPEPEKNVHTTLLFPPGNFAGVGGRAPWPFVWDFWAANGLPRTILCSKLPSPRNSGQMAIVCGTGCSSKGWAMLQGFASQGTHDGLWHEPSSQCCLAGLCPMCSVGCMRLCFRVPQTGNAVADWGCQLQWGTA